MIINTILLAATIISSATLKDPIITDINLEHAITQEQTSTGMMGRAHLANNSGMTFNFTMPQRLSFWSLGCYIDLSLAYLDEDKIIREIHYLPAYPDKIKGYAMKEIKNLSSNDPIIRFFSKKSVASKVPLQYVLEMNYSWFDDNSVQIGDVAVWNTSSPNGYISHTIDLDRLVNTEEENTTIELYGDHIHSFHATKENLACYDKNLIAVPLKRSQHNIFISTAPIKYAVIGPKN